MSWTNIKLRMATMCLVAILCYLPSVALDLYLSRSDLIKAETYKLLRSMERQRGQSSDIQYRIERLADGFRPLFYPDLIRHPEDTFTRLAKKHDVAPLAPQPRELLYYCNEGYGLIAYRSDRYGFRNPDDVWDKEDKTFIIGDSFVHGACVPDQGHTIAGYLSAVTNAINLGTSSNGPIHYAAIAKTIAGNFFPKNVVMVFYPNDNLFSDVDNVGSYYFDYYWRKNKKPYLVRRDAEYQLNSDLILFYNSTHEILLSQANLHDSYTKLEAEAHKFSEFTANEAHKFIVNKNGFFDSFSIENMRLEKLRLTFTKLMNRKKTELPFSTKLAIDELQSVCRDRCNPIVVYIPNSELWRPDDLANSYRRKLREYTRAKNILFIDTTKRLRSLTDSEAYATKGPHLSPTGYQVVSDVIARAIER